MQIMGISQSSSTNFGSMARINQLNGSTLRFEMVQSPNRKYVNVVGDIVRKNKTLQKFKYSCKNEEDIAVIFEKFCKNATDKEDASFRIMDYMIKNMDIIPDTIDFTV